MDYTIQEILANWKYQREGAKEDTGALGKYNKLPLSTEELEKLIVEKLPSGGVLSAYAEVSKALKEPICLRTYGEMLRLYELCEENPYFDVSEVDEVLNMEYSREVGDEKFRDICMDIIAKCPVIVSEHCKLFSSQEFLFHLGKEEDVWAAYHKNFFPKEILEELYEKMQKKGCPKTRLVLLIAWMSV